MDPAAMMITIREQMKDLFKDTAVFGLLLALLSGCNSVPTAKKAEPRLPPTSNPPPAVTVDKPVNVSFSTYSREWPVGWQWIDPDERSNPTPHDVKSGVLRVRLQGGKDLYGENRKAPRYMKAITGNFQIETRVRFLPKENYQGAGLLIFIDDANYLRFERAYGGVGGGGEGIRLDINDQGQYRPIVTPDEIQTDADEVDLKIVRIDKTLTAYWRIDEEAEWREAGTIESNFTDTVLAGIAVANTAREITAEFAYIKLLPSGKK